jgi:hypothetical protein
MAILCWSVLAPQKHAHGLEGEKSVTTQQQQQQPPLSPPRTLGAR